MSEPEKNWKLHFFICQLKVILLTILITGLLQFSNYLSDYLIKCCPFLLFYMIFEFYVFWKPEEDTTRIFNSFNFVAFLVGAGVFFGVYFAIFHPSAALTFEVADSCKFIGSYSSKLGGHDFYSIIYIDFKFNGQQQLGYGCSSNHDEGSTILSLRPYKFYKNGDQIPCDPDKGDSYDLTKPSSRILNSIRTRQLRVGGSSGGGRSSGGSSSFGRRSSSSSSSCTTSYAFSNVKVASWACLNRDFDLDEYMEPKQCYVSFYNNKGVAQANAQVRNSPKNSYSFALISYSSHPYYPKGDLIALILFAYFPFLISFNGIFQYTTNGIMRAMRLQNDKVQSIDAMENPPVPPQPPGPPSINDDNNKENNINQHGYSQNDKLQDQPQNIHQEYQYNQQNENFVQQQNVTYGIPMVPIYNNNVPLSHPIYSQNSVAQNEIGPSFIPMAPIHNETQNPPSFIPMAPMNNVTNNQYHPVNPLIPEGFNSEHHQQNNKVSMVNNFLNDDQQPLHQVNKSKDLTSEPFL